MRTRPSPSPRPVTVTVSPAADGSHECERPCVEGETRTCHYHFHAQEYYTMSRACYSCPDNLDDCSREECIVADGTSVPVLVINRQMPGPSIQVSTAAAWHRCVCRRTQQAVVTEPGVPAGV